MAQDKTGVKPVEQQKITPEVTAKLAANNKRIKTLLAKMLAIKEELQSTLKEE